MQLKNTYIIEIKHIAYRANVPRISHPLVVRALKLQRAFEVKRCLCAHMFNPFAPLGT
jgi:hypothetical protein